jgi:hypothetical protein
MWAVVDPGTGARQLASVFTIGLPALLGPGGQWPTAPVLEALTPALLGVYGLVWIGLLAARVRTWRGGSDPSPAGGAALDALLALPVLAAAACALSPVGWFLSEPRYLLPLGAIVPILIAASLTTLWQAGQRGRATVLGTAVVAVNLAGHVLAPWTSAREAPRSLEATVAFFEARRIPVVATTYWIGSRLAFESAERVVAVPIRDGVDRYPPYVALARRTDRLAYAFFEGTADVGATEERLETLGVARHRTSLGELVILHDLRLPGLEPAPPGLFFETLERLPLLEARLRIAAAYETAGLTDRAIRYLEAILEPGMPAGSAGVDRLVSLYRATGEPAKASALAARRAAVYTPAEPREADFGAAVRLLGYTLGRRSVRAGERVELVCFWSTRRRLEADLYLGVQVTGAMRRHLGSFGPVTGGYSATSWQPDEAVPGALDVAIPRDFPPGRYALRIRLWDSRKGEPDPRPGPRGHPGGSRWLTLTEIDIEPPG